MGSSAARSLPFAILLLAGASSAGACSCMGSGPMCSSYWSTSLLFLGRVARIEHIYDQPPGKVIGPGQYLVHFNITKGYRGDPGPELVIHTPDQGSACGFDFKEGHDYLVSGYAAPNGALSTDHCTRTHEVTNPESDVDIRWIEALPKAPPGGSIFGQIQSMRPNQDGGYGITDLAGIGVSINGPESKSVSSDAEGKFRVDGLAPGKYVISAAAPERYAPFRDSTVTLADRGCSEVLWRTLLDGHIRGHVYFSDGTPAAGVYMTAKSADAQAGQPWTWRASYQTSTPDGAFDFGTMAPGSYVFAVNMDFAPSNGTPYYRKAYFPGAAQRSGAAIVTVGPGETSGELRFFLPPDSPPASLPLKVRVLGFQGEPVAGAQILAFDAMWENSVTAISATTDEKGNATLALRPGSHYDIEAFVNLPGGSQSCAEPLAVEAHGELEPLVLVLRHPFGNCLQFKAKRKDVP